MGNFSRDKTFDKEKHYVGIRLQQGVPLIDADWNEQEDLRRDALEDFLKWFIGNGVPDGTDGFRIEALAGGGVNSIVLTAATAISINRSSSTAADVLGFGADNYSALKAVNSQSATLMGYTAEPFDLTVNNTLAINIKNSSENNSSEEIIITFQSVDFANLKKATASEVVVAINKTHNDIATVSQGNDFRIIGGDGTLEGAGRCLVEGWEARINVRTLKYTEQLLYNNDTLATAWNIEALPSLKPPSTGERTDLVYLDVWDREVNYQEDSNLVNPLIGIESCVRLKREWVVRVAEGVTEIKNVSPAAGHRYLAIATIQRQTNEKAITSITDLRVCHLNVAKYLKVPIYLKRGNSVLDADSFAEMLKDLKAIWFSILQQQIIFNYKTDYNRSLVQIAIQDIIQQSAFAAIQAQAGNFNNQDALHFMSTLYEIQTDLVNVVKTFGNEGDSAKTFISDYQKYLEGSPRDKIMGLKPALEDLLMAFNAQKEINIWLSLLVDELPEGNVFVSLYSIDSSDSSSNLIKEEVSFTITYEVESKLSSPLAREAYDISFAMIPSSSSWIVSLNNKDRIEVDAWEGRETVVLTIIPKKDSPSVHQFKLIATSVRNPKISFVEESEEFKIGNPFPFVNKEFSIQWLYPPISGNYIPISKSEFVDDKLFKFRLQLVNRLSASQKFRIENYVTVSNYVIVSNIRNVETWAPTQSAPFFKETIIDSSESFQFDGLIIAPTTSPSVGTKGTLFVKVKFPDDLSKDYPPLKYDFLIIEGDYY